MTSEVIITGSGCPRPSAHRAGPGALVRSGGQYLQFDVGRGTVQRLTQAGINLADITAVFITHHHSDHLVGLPDLVMTRWIMDSADTSDPLPIIAPQGPAADFVRHMLDVWAADLTTRKGHTGRSVGPRYEVIEFSVANKPQMVWEHDGVSVFAGQVCHEPVRPAVGFRIETPDGTVAITGDTKVCNEVAELAERADVLVYEAMRFEPIQQLPPHRQFILDYHADTRLIGKQANELGIAKLILTHLIPEPQTDEDRAAYEADIRAGGFAGDLIIADDLDSVTLDRPNGGTP